MKGIAEIKADNARAASRELAELRADTVKGLRHAFENGGTHNVLALLEEAEVLPAVSQWVRQS